MPEPTPARRARRCTLTPVALTLCSILIACNGKPTQVGPGPSGPVSERDSSAGQRESVAITVYNQNFGLVREVRKVALGEGRVSLEFSDVSAHIQPETVHIKALDADGGLAVLEQNYRYDILSPKKLLDKYVGKKVKIYRFNKATGKDELHEAEVLASKGGTVLEIGGEITYGFAGRFAFPKVPSNLIAKPTLVWLLDSKAAEQRVEVSYLSRRLNWRADYVLVVDQSDSKGDVTGWVTLTNNSGASYLGAKLKLVAGDVQRVSQPHYYSPPEDEEAGDDDDDQFHEEGFFEYHLYTLQRPTSLLDKEQKQVALLEAHDIGIVKKLIFYGAKNYYRRRYGRVQSNQKVGVYLDILNSKTNNLGMALPKGIVRVYKADSSGAKQFIGEDRIDHTPRDEKIRIKMGEAFDVVGERKQIDWDSLGNCNTESEWAIELRTHKDTATAVEVYEPIGGDWKIIESSHQHTKKDSRTFTFDVQVPARGKTKITYRVRVRWC